jgi:hypothetical protein
MRMVQSFSKQGRNTNGADLRDRERERYAKRSCVDLRRLLRLTSWLLRVCLGH